MISVQSYKNLLILNELFSIIRNFVPKFLIFIKIKANSNG